MSLVEQTIARLKKEQEKASPRPARGRSPHEGSPAPTLELEDTASLASKIPVDYAALRTQGYFPEEARDRQFADQYRRIKRPIVEKALAVSPAAGQSRVVMVTSALPGDGKTFTSINLALSMALERDMSVLLVDADTAKRHVSGIFGLDDKPGLVDALLDESADAEAAVLPTTTRGLSILPAGQRTDGVAELLSSNRMHQLLSELCARNQRRVLLLDSPPLLVTNEGQSLLKIAGQVVLVVRAGRTPRPAVQAAVALLAPEQAGGVVLNDAPGESGVGYYGYTYGAYGAEAGPHGADAGAQAGPRGVGVAQG